MSDTSKKADTAKDGAAVVAPAAVAPTKYTTGRLRKDCYALYGVSTSTFDGANVGIAANAEYTVEEMGTRIKKWQDTPDTPKKKEDT